MSAKLVTLDRVREDYPDVSRRTLWRKIKNAKLAAVKIGRSWFVDPADVERLFRPVVHVPPPTPTRESERARTERQLSRAGLE